MVLMWGNPSVFKQSVKGVIIHHSYRTQTHTHTHSWMSSGQPQHLVVDWSGLVINLQHFTARTGFRLFSCFLKTGLFDVKSVGFCLPLSILHGLQIHWGSPLTVPKCCFEPWNAKGKEGQKKEDETLHSNLYNNINRIHPYNMTTNWTGLREESL